MAASEDMFTVRRKRKAVTAFFPYAVWRERGGDHWTMGAFLAAVKVFDSTTSLWHPIAPFIPTLSRRQLRKRSWWRHHTCLGIVECRVRT